LGASAARLGPLRHVLRPTPPKTRHLRTRHLISKAPSDSEIWGSFVPKSSNPASSTIRESR
jgi:hypothetical protein